MNPKGDRDVLQGSNEWTKWGLAAPVPVGGGTTAAGAAASEGGAATRRRTASPRAPPRRVVAGSRGGSRGGAGAATDAPAPPSASRLEELLADYRAALVASDTEEREHDHRGSVSVGVHLPPLGPEFAPPSLPATFKLLEAGGVEAADDPTAARMGAIISGATSRVTAPTAASRARAHDDDAPRLTEAEERMWAAAAAKVSEADLLSSPPLPQTASLGCRMLPACRHFLPPPHLVAAAVAVAPVVAVVAAQVVQAATQLRPGGWLLTPLTHAPCRAQHHDVAAHQLVAGTHRPPRARCATLCP